MAELPRRCPFCGTTTNLTKEHVWPQWLRDTPGAMELLANDHGERTPNLRSVMTTDDEGRYQSEEVRLGHWALRLPNVTVDVCKPCNTGWMSQLESCVAGLLKPLLIDQRPITLGEDDQRLLATWAYKTFMTYALNYDPLSNPFRDHEYTAVANDSGIPPHIRIWISHVDSENAHVGLALVTWATYRQFDPKHDPDNSALGMLATGGIVFLLAANPVPDLLYTELMAPPGAPQEVVEITNPSGPLTLHHPKLGEEFMDAISAWLETPRSITLPSPDGLDATGLRTLQDSFLAGMPIEAAHRFNPKPDRSFDGTKASINEAQAHADADRCLNAGRANQAARILTRASRTHFNAGDFSGGARLAWRAHTLPGSGLEQDPEAAYRIARCYWNLNDVAGAYWYRKSILLGLPGNAPKFGEADCLAWGGQYAAALDTLVNIDATSPEEEVTQQVAVSALEHLVYERGLLTQTREPISEDNLTVENEVQLDALLTTHDALNRVIWNNLSLTDDTTLSQVIARAWFGEQALHWLQGALAIRDMRREDLTRSYLQLGLKRIPDLFIHGREYASSLMQQPEPLASIGYELDQALDELQEDIPEADRPPTSDISSSS